jgi:hypothetical protein
MIREPLRNTTRLDDAARLRYDLLTLLQWTNGGKDSRISFNGTSVSLQALSSFGDIVMRHQYLFHT